jgi:hypothetical protein
MTPFRPQKIILENKRICEFVFKASLHNTSCREIYLYDDAIFGNLALGHFCRVAISTYGTITVSIDGETLIGCVGNYRFVLFCYLGTGPTGFICLPSSLATLV